MTEKNTEETGPVAALAVTQQGSTFAERAAARSKVAAKQVDADSDVENKAVVRPESKSRARRK